MPPTRRRLPLRSLLAGGRTRGVLVALAAAAVCAGPVSAVADPAATTPTTPALSADFFKILSVAVHGSTFTVDLGVPAPGTVTLKASVKAHGHRAVCTGPAQPVSSDINEFTLKACPTAKSVLASVSRHTKLRVPLVVHYAETGGGSVTRKKTLHVSGTGK
jgi:hypothetical protein